MSEEEAEEQRRALITKLLTNTTVDYHGAVQVACPFKLTSIHLHLCSNCTADIILSIESHILSWLKDTLGRVALSAGQTLVGMKRARMDMDSEQEQSWGVLRVYSDGPNTASPTSSPSAAASDADRLYMASARPGERTFLSFPAHFTSASAYGQVFTASSALCTPMLQMHDLY